MVSYTNRQSDAESLVVDLVRYLEQRGIKPESYTLADHVDIEALVTFTNSLDGSYHIEFTVLDETVTITDEDRFIQSG